ncbi:MAG: sigma-70 family RNA polymerase sigma factor [Holophagales bacterium]|nr:sigma-70 family RNA polymerase sigma factor [Holophagales bacterium]
MSTDWDLVQAVVRGDTGAEEELVRRYRPLVLGLARSRYGFSDPDAEDVLQTTLLTLWQGDRRALRAWQGRGRFSTYLTVIVCRLCRERRAKASPGEDRNADGEGRIPAEPGSPAPDPAAETLGRERSLLLRRALGSLSPRDRLVLALRFFDERTPKDFAVELGLSAGAARKAVHDALARLRQHLQPEQGPAITSSRESRERE